jgi:hypothetical protein
MIIASRPAFYLSQETVLGPYHAFRLCGLLALRVRICFAKQSQLTTRFGVLTIDRDSFLRLRDPQFPRGE